MHAPEAGQVSSQLPDEQSIVHGETSHALWQFPEEQAHIPPEHEVTWRAVPVPGSAIVGPPFGEPAPALLIVPLDPPQATTQTRDKARRSIRMRKATSPFDGTGS